MKLFVILILIFIFSSASVAAQQTCPLADSPAVYNLKLGMLPEQAQIAVGSKLKIKFKTTDEKVIFQNYIDNSPPPTLAGTRAIYLRFFDRRLYQIEIFYQENPAVKTLTDFTDSLAAKWNFPDSVWQREEIKSVINCGNFSVTAMKILNPKIEITDETVRARVEELREKDKK